MHNMANRNSGKENNSSEKFPLPRIQIGLAIAVGGFFIFIVGAKPELFLLDRSPVIGFIQIAVMLFGLGLICLGGYECLRGLWRGNRLSIAAELGVRFISTGYVIAIFSGLADILGLGSHPTPLFVPYFGEWQARGIQIAEGFIAIGMLMMLPIADNPLFRSQPSHEKEISNKA